MNKAFKSIAFVAALTMGLLLPLSANAQYYKGSLLNDDPTARWQQQDGLMNNRDIVTWTAANGIFNNGIGQSEVPVGSGLLILTAASVGYAALRRKRSRKGTAVLLACLLLLGFSQCKKEEPLEPAQGEKVHVTLTVDGGASRVDVDPTHSGANDYATVDFEEDDLIYVGNNGTYCGYLTYDGTAHVFSGELTPTSSDDYLHFYFMGNKRPASEPFSVSITDQMDKYPVISYAHSTVLYSSTTSTYSARLLNKCAIMKFNTTSINKVITITGMYNTVAINFAANNAAQSKEGDPFSYSMSGSGRIRLHAESNTERWAILLPQPEVSTATAYAEGYTTTGTFTVPAVSANGYYKDGVEVTLSAGFPCEKAFTINNYGDQVYIASGNLQATTSSNGASWDWHFAPNPWDYVGVAYSNRKINGDGTVSENGTVDLFGWVGASNTAWEGLLGSTENAAMHGVTNSKTLNSTDTYGNVSDETLKSDWGNTINDGYTWRTMTMAEWSYLFNTRASGSTVNGAFIYTTAGGATGTVSNARYSLATINSVHGLIIFPNGVTFEGSEATWRYINDRIASSYGSTSWNNGTQCTTDQWTDLAAKGCVFLPAAGHRNGQDVHYYSGEDNCGHYWTSTPNGTNQALFMRFVKTEGAASTSFNHERWYGHSVRLVRDAN